MSGEIRRQREMVLIDILLSCLDLHAKATEAKSPILVYLAELLTKRAREELGETAQLCEDERASLHPREPEVHPIN